MCYLVDPHAVYHICTIYILCHIAYSIPATVGQFLVDLQVLTLDAYRIPTRSVTCSNVAVRVIWVKAR